MNKTTAKLLKRAATLSVEANPAYENVDDKTYHIRVMYRKLKEVYSAEKNARHQIRQFINELENNNA